MGNPQWVDGVVLFQSNKLIWFLKKEKSSREELVLE
jgi:hypothetical protein